jgi:hypothetical protein
VPTIAGRAGARRTWGWERCRFRTIQLTGTFSMVPAPGT